jgi:hypothetical protein
MSMRQARPGRPLVFTHIPRTAGTSLRNAVQSSLEPEVVFDGYGQVAFGSFSDVDSLHAKIRRQIAFSPAELPVDAQFVSGHISPSTTRARFPDAGHFTVLREPRVRLISHWLFARAHSDFQLRRWRGFAPRIRAARSSLLDYIANPLVAAHVDNGMARLLLWPHEDIPSEGFIDPVHDDELFEEAVAILDSFAYVGILENPDFSAELGEWLGHPLSLPRLNEVSAFRQPDTPDLTAEVSGGGADLLRWRTRIDARLWSHIAARCFGVTRTNELCERVYEEAVERYSTQLTQRVQLSYPRRILERSYSLAARVRRGPARAIRQAGTRDYSRRGASPGLLHGGSSRGRSSYLSR